MKKLRPAIGTKCSYHLHGIPWRVIEPVLGYRYWAARREVGVGAISGVRHTLKLMTKWQLRQLMLVPAKGPVSGPFGVCTTATTGSPVVRGVFTAVMFWKKNFANRVFKNNRSPIGSAAGVVPSFSVLIGGATPEPHPATRPKIAIDRPKIITIAGSALLALCRTLTIPSRKTSISSYVQIGPSSTAIFVRGQKYPATF